MDDHGSLSRPAFDRQYPGESETLEFKQGVSENKIAEAVTAFSNTNGGAVVMGVGPDRTLHGLAVDGEMTAKVHRAVGKVHRAGRYELESLLVDAVSLLVLRVSRRNSGYAQTSDGRVLVRRGAMNVALLGEELDEFVAAHALRRFESTAVEADLADADHELLDRLAAVYGWRDHLEDRLVERGFAKRAGAGTRLTVAGSLYLLPDPVAYLGKAYIEVFRYRDDETEDKRYTVSGPLPRQVEETTRRIFEEIGRDMVVLGVHRYELDRLPTEVLREAVANAVAHRVYEDNRRSVRVEVRQASVRITSPGPLPEPVTVETMREQNAARNVRVIEALRRFHLAEDQGRGVDLMQDSMAEHLLDPPRFQADAHSVTVTLPLTSTVTTTERAWVREIESRGELRPRDRAVLVHAARGKALTNGHVRELMGIDSTHARASLQRLRDAGLLRQVGRKSGARYVLGDGISPPAGLRLTAEDVRDTVLALAEERPVTNRLVRERLAVDRTEALRLLKQLVARGDLVQEGERRGTRYRLVERADESQPQLLDEDGT